MASYGNIYRYIFDSRQGYTVEVIIAKKDYTGGVTNRALGRAPVLRRDNNENISGTSLELYVEAAVPGEYEQFYTSAADEFKVALYRNGRQLWTGFVEPELYSEPDLPVPYDVRIIATDGLGELKRHDYELEGTHTLREHFNYILSKTGVDREILFSSKLMLKTSATSYSSNVLLDSVEISLDHELGKTCYNVLQHLLAAFNAGITMHDNYWLIYRETDLRDLVNPLGLSSYLGTGNKTLSIVSFGSMSSSNWWPIGNMQSALIPAKKSVNLTAPYNYKENLFKDSQWMKYSGASYDEQEGAFALPSAGAQISHEVTFSSNAYVRDRLVLKMKARNVGIGDEESPLTVRIEIYGRVSSAANSSYYLQGTIPTPSRPNPAPYVWRTAVGNMEFSLAAPADSDTKENAQEIKVVIPLYTGTRSFAYAYNAQVILTNSAGTYGVYLYDISLSQYDREEGIKVAANIENNAREKAGDVDLHMADTAKLNAGSNFLMSGLPVSPTGQYFIRWEAGEVTGQSYVDMMAADYAKKLGSIRRQYTGRLNVGDTRIPALFSRGGVYYFPRSYSYDLYEDEMEVDLISIPDVNVEVEIK